MMSKRESKTTILSSKGSKISFFSKKNSNNSILSKQSSKTSGSQIAGRKYSNISTEFKDSKNSLKSTKSSKNSIFQKNNVARWDIMDPFPGYTWFATSPEDSLERKDSVTSQKTNEEIDIDIFSYEQMILEQCTQDSHYETRRGNAHMSHPVNFPEDNHKYGRTALETQRQASACINKVINKPASTSPPPKRTLLDQAQYDSGQIYQENVQKQRIFHMLSTNGDGESIISPSLVKKTDPLAMFLEPKSSRDVYGEGKPLDVISSKQHTRAYIDEWFQKDENGPNQLRLAYSDENRTSKEKSDETPSYSGSNKDLKALSIESSNEGFSQVLVEQSNEETSDGLNGSTSESLVDISINESDEESSIRSSNPNIKTSGGELEPITSNEDSLQQRRSSILKPPSMSRITSKEDSLQKRSSSNLNPPSMSRITSKEDSLQKRSSSILKPPSMSRITSKEDSLQKRSSSNIKPSSMSRITSKEDFLHKRSSSNTKPPSMSRITSKEDSLEKRSSSNLKPPSMSRISSKEDSLHKRSRSNLKPPSMSRISSKEDSLHKRSRSNTKPPSMSRITSKEDSLQKRSLKSTLSLILEESEENSSDVVPVVGSSNRSANRTRFQNKLSRINTYKEQLAYERRSEIVNHSTKFEIDNSTALKSDTLVDDSDSKTNIHIKNARATKHTPNETDTHFSSVTTSEEPTTCDSTSDPTGNEISFAEDVRKTPQCISSPPENLPAEGEHHRSSKYNVSKSNKKKGKWLFSKWTNWLNKKVKRENAKQDII